MSTINNFFHKLKLKVFIHFLMKSTKLYSLRPLLRVYFEKITHIKKLRVAWVNSNRDIHSCFIFPIYIMCHKKSKWLNAHRHLTDFRENYYPPNSQQTAIFSIYLLMCSSSNHRMREENSK